MRTTILILTLIIICGTADGQRSNNYTSYLTDSREIRDFCFSSSGKTIFIPDNKTVKLFSSSTGELLNSIETIHKNIITALIITGDSTILCTGDMDGLLIVKNLLTGDFEAINENHGLVTALSVSSNGSYMAAGYSDGTVMMYNLLELKPVYYIKGSFSQINDIEFSPDCSLIAVAGAGPTILLANAQTGKVVSKLPGHKSWSRDVSFNNTGDRIITCGDDGYVNIYSVNEASAPKKIMSRRAVFKWIVGATFLPDNKSFAYLTDGGTITTETPFSVWKKRELGIAYKIGAVPRKDSIIRIVVSLKNKGVIVLNPLNFEVKE